MRLLVTGGAGFIGSHLTRALIARGDAVTVLDDLSTGSWDNLSDLSHLGDTVRRVEGSILDRALVSALTADADAIAHLASVVGVRRVLEQPLTTVDVILHGTRHVLDAALARGCPVLIASSSEVYGHALSLPSAEDSPSALGAAPRWIYAAAKLLDDMTLQALCAERGLRGVSARLFNVVGPGQRGDYGMVLPRFVRAALRGDPITVYGDGLQTRTFAHVADIVPALISLLDRLRHDPASLCGQVVNLGSPHPVTIRALAERVRDRVGAGVGAGVELQHLDPADVMPPGFDEIRARVPDTSRAQALIGFRCRYDLDAIIDDVITHLRPQIHT